MRLLVFFSAFALGIAIFLAWKGLGNRSFQQAGQRPWLTPDYLAKREIVEWLEELKGRRPFTSDEMAKLREFARDPIWMIRCRALRALSYAQTDQQRKEAIQIAVQRLRDKEGVVRFYAVLALDRLQARETVPDLLPLLNDPDPDVRKVVLKTLTRFGYSVESSETHRRQKE